MDELTDLSKVECGPRFLSEKAIAWAKSSNWFSRKLGEDKYLPETLHLAVRSTRYGCRRDGSLADVSREAFAELHKLYPNSSWTKQTLYWFDGVKGPTYENRQNDQTPATAASIQPKPLNARVKDFLRPIWHRLQSIF